HDTTCARFQNLSRDQERPPDKGKRVQASGARLHPVLGPVPIIDAFENRRFGAGRLLDSV
ncbi:MAG TPA: hypothetical protein VLO31_00480, partial [Cryobacterium sp.]|nr:hypothetical protein [Cryobacterium sp.]